MLVHEEVRTALDEGRPVVALESTIIAHGLPRPDNLRVAREIEGVVREHGAVPATIAILGGEVRIGLDDDALEALAYADGVAKCGVRDLAPVVARGGDGATTVAATSHLAERAGHPRVRHRRARRRAPRRARHVRRVGGPRHAGARRDLRRLRGREVDPRHPRHARAPRDAERDRARLPDGHVPRLLPDDLRACRSPWRVDTPAEAAAVLRAARRARRAGRGRRRQPARRAARPRAARPRPARGPRRPPRSRGSRAAT